MSKAEREKLLKHNIKGFARAAVFAAAFLWIFCTLADVFIPDGTGGDDGMESRISRAYRGEDAGSLDALFIGNSDVYRAVSPVDIYAETGITSAVAGQPGKKMSQAAADMKDILRYQDPKVVILETDCMFIGKAEAQPVGGDSGAGVTGESRVKKALRELGKDFVSKTRRIFDEGDGALIAAINYKAPLIKYHDRWRDLSLSSFTDINRKYRFSNKGMVYSDEERPYEGGDYMKDPGSAPAEMEESVIRSFERIVSLCEKNGSRLVLLTVPSANSWNYSKHNAVQALARKHGLAYYDYNEAYPEGFDWKTCTTDRGNHLNYRGALAVTSDFGKRLREDLGLKKTKLTPEQKKAWEQDSIRFRQGR